MKQKILLSILTATLSLHFTGCTMWNKYDLRQTQVSAPSGQSSIAVACVDERQSLRQGDITPELIGVTRDGYGIPYRVKTATKSPVATEIAADGVTVNSIQPGSHLTDRLRSLHADQLDALTADIPVGFIGDPADFGAAAAFLCSEQARFITGTSLLVDGGAARGLI